MAAQIALTGNSQGASLEGISTLGVSTSRTAGGDEFASGLQALLAGSGNSHIPADAPPASDPLAVPANETRSAGSTRSAGHLDQSNSSDVSHLGLKNASLPPKLLMHLKRLPAAKDCSPAAPASVLPSREKNALQLVGLADTNLAKPAAHLNVSITAPVQAPVAPATLPAAKQQGANVLAHTPHASAMSVADNEQLHAEAAIPVALTAADPSALSGPPGLAEPRLQVPANQIPDGLQPAAEIRRQVAAPTSIPPADQGAANSGAFVDPKPSAAASTVSAASLQLEAPDPNTVPGSGTGSVPGSNRDGVRRINPASSSGRSAASAHPASASFTVGESAAHPASVSAGGMAAGMAGLHNAGQRELGPAACSSATSSPQTDPFTALDSATASPATTWIHAGARHAEAGYLDPALGWVSVRADGTADGVHAALVPGSPEAASALGTQLAGLNAFMAGHQCHTATVTMASPEPGNSHSGTTQQDGSMSGQQHPQQPQDRNQAAPYARAPSPKSLESDSALGDITPGAYITPNGSGVHLSVMA